MFRGLDYALETARQYGVKVLGQLYTFCLLNFTCQLGLLVKAEKDCSLWDLAASSLLLFAGVTGWNW